MDGAASPSAAPLAAPAARVRLPLEPYPGLRPFLDFEAALLFGRERQVREVIERLRATQFVAVLGGSGSGKSSLIHAGVTPALRSFGIPGAGDFWVTMVCTPGTNSIGVKGVGRRHTPITRLAWKFAALLRTRGSAEQDARRLDEIAEVFRQEAGFARLMDTYADELAVPPGPDVADVRLMFILDQFEEIFHPTNAGVDDAALLVERVIDHFFNPHPRCYVVLTMRSEHLNDCAGYLELPDAINRSSYLVRRLDPDELRDAIVAPAQRFLRLCARAPDADAALPEAVAFEPALLERLLRDVGAITHDPDHLPLLQHLLARLWQTAREREGGRLPVPAQIGLADLARAVAGSAAQPLDEQANTLRASLENWAEAAWQRHPAAQHPPLDALLRRLAFKDPNTGMYTQQRVNVDDAAAILGAGRTRDDLHELIQDGFIGSVDYLFWDDEDPSRVTLKVSHESFIRGWARFRRLVDAEAERFDEFVATLRKCADWEARGRTAELLLEAGDLRRLGDVDLAALLRAPAERAAWFRFLLLDRDGARLARLEPELDAYLAASAARQRALERGARNVRVGWLVSAAVALVLLPSAMFSLLIQEPVTQRALLFFQAGNLANRTAQAQTYVDARAGRDALGALVGAAGLIAQARSGAGPMLSRLSQTLIAHFSAIPAVKRQQVLLDGVAGLVEPQVNGRLRAMQTSWLWPAGVPQGTPFAAPQDERRACVVGTEGERPQSATGRLISAAGSGDDATRRRVFIADVDATRDEALVLRVARLSPGGACLATQSLMAIPLFIDPALVLDATLRYFMVTQRGANIEVPSVTVHEIVWSRATQGSSRVAGRQQRAVVLDPALVDAVGTAAGSGRLGLIGTYRVGGGRSFEIGSGHWRMVSASAQRLERGADALLQPLALAAPGSGCALLGQGRTAQSGFEARMFDDGRFCYSVTMRNARGDAPREVLAAVFARPSDGDAETLRRRLDDNPPVAIATMNQFTRLVREPAAWLVGGPGRLEGWLAFRTFDRNGVEAEYGAPWSTCALARQGAELAGVAPPDCAGR